MRHRATARKFPGRGILGSMIRTIAVLALFLGGCGAGNKPAAGAAGADADVCPADVHTHESWSYDGTDDECRALAELLAKDAGKEGAPCAGEMGAIALSAAGGVCTAAAVAECDGAKLETTCTVERSGDADCTVIVTSDQLAAKSCKLQLTAR